MTSEQSLS